MDTKPIAEHKSAISLTYSIYVRGNITKATEIIILFAYNGDLNRYF